MKCVRYTGRNGERVVRVEDHVAEALVKVGGKYVSKDTWRAAGKQRDDK